MDENKNEAEQTQEQPNGQEQEQREQEQLQEQEQQEQLQDIPGARAGKKEKIRVKDIIMFVGLGVMVACVVAMFILVYFF